jgi:peptidoglycan/LPS O-acetylase OafA/YrhL
MNRFKQIDILRAIAVFLVLGRHMVPCPSNSSVCLRHLTQIWNRGGWIGVDLFFVLSGFLVSGLLFREYEKHGRLQIWSFLIRRGFKIYPPFWFFIGVSLFMLDRHGHFLHRLAFELLFLQNWSPGLWGHTWSLAVEEHFYFLLAFVLFMLARRTSQEPFTIIPSAFVAVALVCLFLRILPSARSPYSSHLYQTHLRLDALFFGVLLSYWFHRRPVQFLSFAQRFRYPLACVGVLALFPAFWLPLESTPFIFTYGLTLFYLASGCLLISAIGCPPPTSRVVTAVAYVGSHSYSIYLWHMPVAIWGTAIFGGPLSPYQNWFAYAAAYLFGSIVFGVAMAVLIEIPVLRIRERLFPSRAMALSSDATGSNNALLRAGSTGTACSSPSPPTARSAAAPRVAEL